jgi:hypothetical protein
MYIEFQRQAILMQNTIFFIWPAQQEIGSEDHKNYINPRT